MEERENLLSQVKADMRWNPPNVPKDIPHGDMPGDKVEIHDDHILKADKVFPEILKQLRKMLEESGENKAVVTVCGGSGVGKSAIASLLSYYFNQLGIGSYTLSGDNYPHRIPRYNDGERLRIFRESAIKGMMQDGTFSMERFHIIHEFQKKENDANPAHITEYPWYESYIRNGREGLKDYLGSEKEIAFSEIEEILRKFKNNENEIWLKRMGREDTELWYEKINFSKIQILVIEWTHGNSDNYQGVDIPVFLNSTPQETLEHRKKRNRDIGTDSAFTTMVLELEQNMLESQSHKAKIIISKSGDLLSYEQYKKMMKASRKSMD